MSTKYISITPRIEEKLELDSKVSKKYAKLGMLNLKELTKNIVPKQIIIPIMKKSISLNWEEPIEYVIDYYDTYNLTKRVSYDEEHDDLNDYDILIKIYHYEKETK